MVLLHTAACIVFLRVKGNKISICSRFGPQHLSSPTVLSQHSSVYEHGQGHADLHSLKSVENRLSLFLPLVTTKVFQTAEQISSQGEK